MPAGSTAPTVALRAEMTPSSGASTCVWRSRSSCTLAAARVASRRAFAVRSAVRYWLICCALKAPVVDSSRARCALAEASASVASASATPARVWFRSAWIVSGAKVASTWPRRTRSPTPTRTSASRSPLASVPTLASCHAAMLPLALNLTGSVAVCGVVVVTVSADLAADAAVPGLSAFFSSAACTSTRNALTARAATARAREVRWMFMVSS